MQYITQYPWWVRAIALVTTLALFGALIHFSNATEPISEETNLSSHTTIRPEEAITFGYAVSGIIESTDSVTVRALTNGTIRERFALEGSVVSEGDVLLRQESPLLTERMTLQDAQNGLSTLMQEASVIGYGAEKESARIQSDAASTSVLLTKANSGAGVESATSLLSTQIYGSVTSLVAALDFIDANKMYFEGEDLTEFRRTVDALYGSNRTYLSGSVQYSFKSHDDILAFLDTLTKGSMYPDTTTLIEVAELVDRELDATKRVFIGGEKDFLDSKVVPQFGDLYTAYLTYRGSVIEAEANLRMAIGGARSGVTGADLGMLGAETEQTLRGIGYTTADVIFKNAEQMARQSDAVAGAAMNILSGEEALGMPQAPFDGIVDKVFVKEGEFVPQGTPLMTVVGSGAKELVVSIPHHMLTYVQEGASFVVEGNVVGHVARRSETALNGNATVVIELIDSDYTPGDILHGTITGELTEGGALALPRAYVAFDNGGSFVRTEGGRVIRVVIIHDSGKVFVVKPVEVITESIIKAVSVAL